MTTIPDDLEEGDNEDLRDLDPEDLIRIAESEQTPSIHLDDLKKALQQPPTLAGPAVDDLVEGLIEDIETWRDERQPFGDEPSDDEGDEDSRP